jgi:uncharacterized membrane protein
MDIIRTSGKRVNPGQLQLVNAGSHQAPVRKFDKSLSALVFATLLSIPTLTQAQYRFTTFDVPESTATAANGNSTHTIAGQFTDNLGRTHGFLLNKDVFTTFDVPPTLGVDTNINGINAKGELAGTYFESTGKVHAFFWSKGVFTTLDPLIPSFRSQGGFLNAKGEVVGTFRDSADKRQGFIWSKGNFTTFHVSDDHPVFGTVAMGINDVGEVVGNFVDMKGDNFHRHGFLRSKDGDFTTFDMTDTNFVNDFTSPTGINNAGQIVGFYASNADPRFLFHGFVLSKGVFTTVDVPDADETQILSINAKGEIVGTYFDKDGQHGFVGIPDR